MKSTIAHDRLQGPGEPVVLIHGIGHRREAWGDVPRLLHERGHDVVVVDLPGFGRSPAPERPDGWSMRSTAEQLERLFRDLGIRRPHVVGNSLGGYLALLLASRGTVRTATALSPAGFFSPHHLVLVTGPQLLFMKIGSHLPTALHRWLNGTPARRKLVMGALYRYPEKITTEDAVGDTLNLRRSPGFWPHFVRAIPLRFRARPRVPTTIAWGDHDRLLLPSEAEAARKRLPGVTHVPLVDSGHCPQIDHPELIVEVAEETFARDETSVGGTSPSSTSASTPTTLTPTTETAG